ncbi:glycosyltransferase family 9 protein, partial [bacterium]|nr:glycosyltransferase family 9 protein [bacterium]
MGDIIQSIPFFRRLRGSRPDAEIHVLVEKCFGDVIRMVPGVDAIHEIRLEDLLPDLEQGRNGNVPKATTYYRNLVENLKRENYSEVWNLTHTRPSMVLNYLLAAEHGRGVTLDRHGLQRVNSPWLSYFFATNLARPWCQFNLADIYANCIDEAEWETGRSIRIAQSDIKRDHPLSCVSSRIRIAIHPGASQDDKRWSVESYRQLARRLLQRGDVEIVIVAGKRDVELGRKFEGIEGIVNLAGQTNVPDLASVLANCRLLVSNDSGPMHVAAAVGTPVLDITVGSALASETAPYGENHVVVEPESACFPCSSRNPCSSELCGSRITPQVVLRLCEWMLGLRGIPQPQELAHCRVYRTGFSEEDGLLELRRIGATQEYARDEIHRQV